MANRHGSKPTAILISGSGDGAMQDFQRAATGRFGRDLYDVIVSAAASAGRNFDPETLMRDASFAEDAARRAHALRPNGFDITEARKRWDDTYDGVVAHVLTGWGASTVTAVARTVLRPELQSYLSGSPGTSVLWIMREAVAGYAYGLNRLLSSFIAQLIRSEDARTKPASPVGSLKQHEIIAIAPQRTRRGTHACRVPEQCYAEPHNVQIAPAGTTSSFGDTYDLILVRHGMKPEWLLGGASVPEQYLPFDLPY
jgi:hypothetical protein